MSVSRARLAQIWQAFGDQVRVDQRQPRQQETPPQRLPVLDPDTQAINKWKAEIETDSSDEDECKPWRWTPGSTDFEADWARLPSAITSVRYSKLIKDQVVTNSVGKSTFQRSLTVLRNGIDRLYIARPTTLQLLQHLYEGAKESQEDVVFVHGGLFQSHVNVVSLCKALWEFGSAVPRDLDWYSFLPTSTEQEAFESCHPAEIEMHTRQDLGLSPVSQDSRPDAIYCGVAGAKSPIKLTGPAVGLLYAVIEGTLLLLSWPATDHNYSIWYRINRGLPLPTANFFFCFKDLQINVLRTGDAVHVPAGTITLMMALTHVGMVSREIFNPSPAEIDNIIRLSNFMMDLYLSQRIHSLTHLDHLDVKRIEKSKRRWDEIVREVRKGHVPRKFHRPDEHTEENIVKDIQEVRPILKIFTKGMKKVDKKIKRYNRMAEAAIPAERPEGCSCPDGGSGESQNAAGGSGTSSSDSDHSISGRLAKCIKSTNKGECRVHG